MKKLFILVFSLGMLNTVFAQHNDSKDWKNDSRDKNYGQSKKNDKDWKDDRRDDNYGQSKKNGVYNDGRYSNNNSNNVKERNQRLAQIRRETDDQIQNIRRDRRLNNSEKQRQIAMIERQRDNRINQLNQYYAQNNNGRYDNNNGRYDDRTASNDRKW